MQNASTFTINIINYSFIDQMYGSEEQRLFISQVLQQSLTSLQQSWWNNPNNTEAVAQIIGYLGQNGLNPIYNNNTPRTFNTESWEFATEIVDLYISEGGNIKQRIQQAIANGVTNTAEYTHSLFNKLSILANNYPNSINYINQMMNGIRTFILASSLVNTNPSTCTFSDLFNMWLFELGNNPFVINNNTAITTNQLKNQEGVLQAKNIAINKVQNGNFSPTRSEEHTSEL